jgi:hypothetical protein
MAPFKLGRLPDGVWLDPGGDPPETEIDVEHRHGDVYDWERTTGPARLLIAAARAQADLLKRLCALWDGPAWLLFVLRVPRTPALAGRYQSPSPLEAADLAAFLDAHAEFLERDARHQLWIKEAHGPGHLVLDGHNLIFAYGQLELYEDALAALGIRRGAVELPAPHVHHYHPGFDAAEASLLSALDWLWTPLQPQDEEN